jgi:hypothetical protein
MGVLVVIDERQLDRAPMRHDEDPRVVDEFVLGDSDGGAHDAVGTLLSLSDVASPKDATQRDTVLLVQAGYVDGSVAHGSSLASIYR